MLKKNFVADTFVKFIFALFLLSIFQLRNSPDFSFKIGDLQSNCIESIDFDNIIGFYEGFTKNSYSTKFLKNNVKTRQYNYFSTLFYRYFFNLNFFIHFALIVTLSLFSRVFFLSKHIIFLIYIQTLHK